MKKVPNTQALFRRGLLILTALVIAACGDMPTTAPVGVGPELGVTDGAWSGARACPSHPDVVVGSENELLDAIANAEPGQVIGLAGLIGVQSAVDIEKDGVTLTCARPESGLYFEAETDAYLVEVSAASTRVMRLILDGSKGRGIIRAVNDDDARFAEGTTFVHNDAVCGTVACAFFSGVAGVHVLGNRFVSEHPVATGVHLQGHGDFADDGSRPRPIDGSRVMGNRILSLVESTNDAFGGIRLRDGWNVAALSNRVEGPWQNGVALADLRESLVLENVIRDPIQFGIVMGLGSRSVLGTTRSAFDENWISGAGEIGIYVITACRNAFRNNRLIDNGTDGIDGIHFGEESGGNLYVGDPGVIDADWGDFDCDGDGISDPNVIRPLR